MVRNLEIRVLLLFRTGSKLFRSLADDFLHLYKCSQIAAECASGTHYGLQCGLMDQM